MNLPSHEDLVKRRAEFALDAVNSLAGDRAKQRLKGLPVELRTLGLLQTTALLASDQALRPLANHLAQWLLEKCPMKALIAESAATGVRLLEVATNADPSSLRAAEREAIEFAVTMKLFGSAIYG
jgi:hypothetical protein